MNAHTQDARPAGESFFTRLYIAASPQEVWKALVEPEIASLYYLAPLSILEPCVGGKIAYGAQGEPLISGHIRCFQEDAKLEHTFVFTGQGGGEETVVTYTLEAIGEKVTCLELHHTGFASKESPLYHDIADGWPGILSGLKTYLETGHPIPWP